MGTVSRDVCLCNSVYQNAFKFVCKSVCVCVNRNGELEWDSCRLWVAVITGGRSLLTHSHCIQLTLHTLTTYIHSHTHRVTQRLYFCCDQLTVCLYSVCGSAPSDRYSAAGPDHSSGSHRNLSLWHQRKSSTSRLLAKRRQPGKNVLWHVLKVNTETPFALWGIHQSVCISQ